MSRQRIGENHSMFSLEMGREVANLTCDCCGKPFKSVCGFIKKNDCAYSAYFATLQTGHEGIAVGLTVSIGKWWDDSAEAIGQREWVYLRVWPSETGSGFELRIDDPESSRHANTKMLGQMLTTEQARHSPRLDDFFAVSEFIVDHDPAVLSYLKGEEVNIVGRICKHSRRKRRDDAAIPRRPARSKPRRKAP